MNSVIHERPGVYSSYDASSAVSGEASTKTVGVAAIATSGTAGAVVRLHSYEEGVTAFGADATNTNGMSTILSLLFANGAREVAAVRVASTAQTNDYKAAFTALEQLEDVRILVCDSTTIAVQQALRDSVTSASAARKERIAVVGGSEETVSDAVEHAEELNSERVLLIAPDMLTDSGTTLSAVFAAAAVAGAISTQRDPSLPINGIALAGISGLSANFSDTEVDTLVQGGVTPLESVSGTVSPIRGITTRTTTGGSADTTWRELSTVLIIDDVIPAIRNALRAKFMRSKNTVQTRGAIRSQVILELENKLAQEYIDGYSDISVEPLAADPSVCLVSFRFTVAHGLNRIYLTAHITV